MEKEALTKVSLIISGRVQGVFFRQSTRDKAIQLGLAGFVKNESDGTVYVLATGSLPKVEELIAWCHKGPPSASVKHVEVKYLPLKADEPLTRFEVLP